LEGKGAKSSLVLNAHMDVLPAVGQWEFPPFCGEVRQGKILGRGAADMKTGLTASLVAFALIRDLEIELPGKIHLTLVSDEETGGNWGTKWLLDNDPKLQGDACLIAEPGGINAVGIGEKGICELKLKAGGLGAHAAYNLGDNAIVKMSKLIQILVNMIGMKGRTPKDLIDLIQKEKLFIEKEYGRETGLVLDGLSVNVGVIRGGVKVNLVPNSCEIELDIRLPIGFSQYRIRRELEKRFNEAGLQNVDVIKWDTCDGNYTPPNEKIVLLLRKNVKEVVGTDPKNVIKLGATDGRFFRQKHIPTATFGPLPRNMGAPNEYVTVAELLQITKVLSGTIIDYFLYRSFR
jgi:succinyl-diaminopimelate desuccinylase